MIKNVCSYVQSSHNEKNMTNKDQKQRSRVNSFSCFPLSTSLKSSAITGNDIYRERIRDKI